jgi:uncharacterized protein with NRDE domain
MCIYFLFVNNDPTDEDDLQIVIALNRDEYYDRPTLPAHFWNEECIGGVDVQPGREGGTWFGLNSKRQRFGALLNILEPTPAPDKRGRGSLVTDFLQGSETAESYARKISQYRQEFNGFNLVLLDRSVDGRWSVHYCSSQDDKSPREIPPGILAFGNSMVDRPWQKVIKGHEKFEQIVRQHHSRKDADTLKQQLLEMLSDRTSHLPDPVLESQRSTPYPTETAVRSAIYVDFTPFYRYGTRTHTIVLIDGAGRCEFTEKTMKQSTPTDANGSSPPSWQTSNYTFQLG